MNQQKSIRREFFKWTGVLPRYKSNRFEDGQIRANYIFDALAEKIFDHPALLKILRKKISSWLQRDRSAFSCSLAGYVDYFQENYGRATRYFLEALSRDPNNLDAWFDLAFSLYHQGERRQTLARHILFAHQELSTRFAKRRMTLRDIVRFLNDQGETKTGI